MDPVLVDRTEAASILNVTIDTFDRLCREGRFENAVVREGRALYRAKQLRTGGVAHIKQSDDPPQKSIGVQTCVACAYRYLGADYGDCCSARCVSYLAEGGPTKAEQILRDDPFADNSRFGPTGQYTTCRGCGGRFESRGLKWCPDCYPKAYVKDVRPGDICDDGGISVAGRCVKEQRCPECGTGVPVHRNDGTVYCSERCKRSAKRDRRNPRKDPENGVGGRVVAQSAKRGSPLQQYQQLAPPIKGRILLLKPPPLVPNAGRPWSAHAGALPDSRNSTAHQPVRSAPTERGQRRLLHNSATKSSRRLPASVARVYTPDS